MANAVNLLFAGPFGTGKSHLAISLGLEAIRCGYKVYFTAVADLINQVNVATATGQIPNLPKKLVKHDVLILNELGYLRIDRSQGNFLFRLVSQAYEKFSLIITTNKDCSGWAEIFEDQVQVAAMLDRILHHSFSFNIRGDSFRVKHRRRIRLGKTMTTSKIRSRRLDSRPNQETTCLLGDITTKPKVGKLFGQSQQVTGRKYVEDNYDVNKLNEQLINLYR